MSEGDVEPVLPAGEQHGVLAHRIMPSGARHAARQDRPVVVFVAGQPGSGKTRLADLIQAVLERRGGAVRIGRDLYKNAHPRYAAHLAQDVRTAGARVRAETSAWQEAVERHARRHRFDAVVETALADPQEFRSCAAAYREAGFRREVVALAIPEAVSQLSLLHRFLAEALAENGGRYVTWGNHDACASGILRTLAAIETGHLVERVTVVRRDMTVLHSNELTGNGGGWRRPAGAGSAVVRERARAWSSRETEVFRRILARTDQRLHRELHDEDRRLAVQRDSERAAALAEPVRRIAQPKPGSPGVDYHGLSPAEHQWVLEHIVLPGLGPVTRQHQPIAVYVVGQPGAGKTAAADLVQRTLPSSTRITSDDFKAAHPDYLTLLRTEPRRAGAAIRADYQDWQRAAEAHVRERRGHMVIEVAPDSAHDLVASVERAHAAGYRVEVAALAVRAADSRQGTAQRYAAAQHDDRPGRFSTAAGHDRCFQGLAEAVAAAQTHPAVASLLVISRQGRTLWRQTAPRPHRASWALAAERHRPYTEEEARRFLARRRRLRLALPQHRSELEDIAALARQLLPGQRGVRLETAVDGLVETLSALARRQHEHREHTAARLTAVIHADVLPPELHELAVYYLAKAQRDLGRSAASRRGMQGVADRGGRLAPAARRGLAHLARLAGGFPAALDTARRLGWEGRGHRVEGDVWWAQGDTDRAATAYQAARLDAEQHGIAGEQATCQAQRALTLAFTDPGIADDELDLAQQLLAGLDLHATGLTLRIAALVRDAGRTDAEVEDRAEVLRAEVHVAGLVSAQVTLEVAACFHHAVLGTEDEVTATISRLRDLARNGDYAYCVGIAHFMADRPLPAEPESRARWIGGEEPARHRWRSLVTTRHTTR